MAGLAIITEACIDVKDRACVTACPVQCIYEYDPTKNLLFSEDEPGCGEIETTYEEHGTTSPHEQRDEPMTETGLPKIGAPATRALASIGVTQLHQLSTHTAAELLALHGFGPRALRILREALDAQGLTLEEGSAS